MLHNIYFNNYILQIINNLNILKISGINLNFINILHYPHVVLNTNNEHGINIHVVEI